ncbi:hypothetical protein FZEAL_2835 [Fusarium zealandicum]|uniref:Uncharacterized protein n=1 Tax=Fusarium zealandicum TaxID=1053134 RepID=A0A8H4UQS6_9HYPO|nr:hypothetical protein FZEAL_2835 [Fusarium zealandicum]
MAGRSGTESRPGEGSQTGAYRLHDISPRELDQLTMLLWMDPSVNVARPDKEWLQDQELRITTLDESIRCSTSLLNRIIARIEKSRDAPQAARLCAAHRGLNPVLVRRLWLLLVTECGERTDRFRVWRKRIAYPDSISAWLDRIDTVSGMWFGRKAFRATFGYHRTSTAELSVKSGCEACIMSVFGGRPQLLSDLRASLVVRRGKYPGKIRREPRLYRLVDSWIKQFDADCSRAVIEASDKLADEIIRLQDDIDPRREERESLRREAGEPPKSRHRRRPQKESETRKREETIPDRRSRQTGNKVDREGKDGYRGREPRVAEPVREAYKEPGMLGTVDIEQAYENVPTPINEQEDHEASNWIDSRMQGQGLTPEERRQLFEDDMHPAFSDYGARSAVPPPLNFGRGREPQAAPSRRESRLAPSRRDSQPAPSRRESRLAPSRRDSQPAPSRRESLLAPDGQESVWEPIMVYSPPESQAPSQRPDPSIVPPSRNDKWESLPPMDDTEYLGFCEKFGLTPNPEVLTSPPPAPTPTGRAEQTGSETTRYPIPPASSVYSSHPGFRRSQDYTSSVYSQPENKAQDEDEDEVEIVFRDPFDPANNGGRSRGRPRQSSGSHRSAGLSDVSPMGTRHQKTVNVGRRGTVRDDLQETDHDG